MAEKKKPIMVGIIIVCFALAVAISFIFRSRGEEDVIRDIDPSEMIWVKCRNPNCGAVYEISMKEYAIFSRENRSSDTGAVSGMPCTECGDETVYRVEKCEKCGAVFERGSVPEDFSDRCPECGYSAEETRRKESRRQLRNR